MKRHSLSNRTWRLLAGASLLLVLFLSISCGKKNDLDTVLTSELREGAFLESFTVAGTLEAVDASDIATPDLSRNFSLIYLIDEGAVVKPGDRIAAFDTSDIERDLQNVEDRILDKKDEIDNLLANQKDTVTIQSNSIDQLRDNLELEKINQASLQFATEIDRRAGEIRFRGRETDYTNALAKMRSLLQDQARQRRQKMTELRRLEAERDLRKSEKLQCTVAAPKGGLVVYRTRNPFTKEKIKLGDTLRRSQAFLSIPDLNRMQLKLEVNEVDVQRLRRGLGAEIVLDALPDRRFQGTLARIGSLAYGKPSNPEVMIFDAVVLLSESDPEVLRPGMSARATLVLRRFEKVKSLPIDAVFANNQGVGTLYRQNGRKVETVQAKLGSRNDDFIVVDTELLAGSIFLLYHPKLGPGSDLGQFDLKSWKPSAKAQAASNAGKPAGAPANPPAEAVSSPPSGAPAAEGAPRKQRPDAAGGEVRGAPGGGGESPAPRRRKSSPAE